MKELFDKLTVVIKLVFKISGGLHMMYLKLILHLQTQETLEEIQSIPSY